MPRSVIAKAPCATVIACSILRSFTVAARIGAMRFGSAGVDASGGIRRSLSGRGAAFS